MELSQGVAWLLALGATCVVVSTYPYLATAIAYRKRDNGLAYILVLMGVGVWNGMFAAQLLDARPLVEGFFFALSTVGAVLAGLGWFLFACTASTTRPLPRQRSIYGPLAVLVGLDITLAVTSFTHSLYWTFPAESTAPATFAVILPGLGYWLHTALLVALFGAGGVLFATAWIDGLDVRYTRAYAIAGLGTAVTILASGVLFPGGASVAPLVAGTITTVGWIQAQQKLTARIPSPRVLGRIVR